MKVLELNIDMPVRFVSAGHFISTGSWVHPVRTIDTFVLMLGERGVAHLYEGDRQFQLREGEALLLSPFVEQGGTQNSEDVSYYWFHFHPNPLQGQVQTFQDVVFTALDGSVGGRGSSLYLPQLFSASVQDKLFILAHQLLHIYESRYQTPAGDYLMTSLLLELGEQFAEQVSRTSSSGSRSFYKLCEWIRVNSHQKISLDDVAQQFSYNKNYLCRMFKQYAGVTVQDYINRIKIQKVKQLLYSSDKSVQELAYQMGFSDAKYMMRLFKQMEKMTPSQFRNAYSRTHINSR